jgi:prepilin-type N-terminal cleavage/methylation domain-containing protein
MRSSLPRRAFTLIELLVVVTIIVVLLALLTPALDRAIYQAELAVCGANLHAVAAGATGYTVDYKRSYPYRKVAFSNTGNKPAENLCDSANDDRPAFRPYIPIDALADPMGGKVDLDSPPTSTVVWSAYTLWFGWGYISSSTAGIQTQGAAGERIMHKLGDAFTWRGQSFTTLASDFDLISVKDNLMHGAHPDSQYQDGIAYLTTSSDPPAVASWWQNLKGQYRRSPIDMNYVMQDGSVGRLLKVTWDEGRKENGSPGDRIARVPEYPYTQGFDDGRWAHVPVR